MYYLCLANLKLTIMKLSHNNLQWTVDNEQGIIVSWYEGFFNGTQTIKNTTTETDPAKLAAELRKIGDWLMENHSDLCVCDEINRLNVLYNLDNEAYWEILTATHFELFISEDEAPVDTLERLIQHHDETAFRYNEGMELFDAISFLEDTELEELCSILFAFHKYHEEDDHWAREMLWLPMHVQSDDGIG